MEAQYIQMLNELNHAIRSFNRFLSPAKHVPTINMRRLDNVNHISKVVHGNWDAFKWINAEGRGVYFILGCNSRQRACKGMYIGKASYRSTIGRRLWVHFNAYRNRKYFEMKDCAERPYRLEYLTAISLDEIGIGFLASALEEYLIGELKDKVHLLNRTGNIAEE